MFYLKNSKSNLCSIFFKNFAGFPITTSFFFTSLVTTAPAPIYAPSSTMCTKALTTLKIIQTSLILYHG